MTAPADGSCPSAAGPIFPDSGAAKAPRTLRAGQTRRFGRFPTPAQRPAEARSRAEPGHWEGDLIIGKANRTAAATLVERASRHTLVVPLPGGYDAKNTARAVTAALARQPSHMVKTLTWDQGREMARWADIEKKPRHRGVLLRAPLPLAAPHQRANQRPAPPLAPQKHRPRHRPVRLAVIEDNLNTMPRRIHNWNSAQTAYTALSCNHR